MAKSKRKTISDVEKFYIESNPENLAEQDLADKVKCCVTLVREIRSNIIPPKVEVQLDTKPLVQQVVEQIQQVVNTEVNKAVQEISDPHSKAKAAAEKAAIEGTTAVYNGPKAGQLFGRNEKRGVVVMTPAAAEAGDDADAFFRANKPKAGNNLDLQGKGKSNVIHKIRG